MTQDKMKSGEYLEDIRIYNPAKPTRKDSNLNLQGALIPQYNKYNF